MRRVAFFGSLKKRIKEKIKLETHALLSFFRVRKNNLAIFDKFYPDISYTWRTIEFNHLLSLEVNSVLFSESNNYKEKVSRIDFNKHKKVLLELFPGIIKPIQIKYLDRPIWLYNFKFRFVYFLFLEDAIRFYPYLIKTKTSFAFTLYPGGGFILYNDVIDQNIKAICNSKFCQGVFVNGRFTNKYLIERLDIMADKVHLVPGVPSKFNSNFKKPKNENPNFIIGFCAKKYMTRGMDKGFDVFCRIALKMSSLSNIKFICIGDFTLNDMTSDECEKANIEFKGLLQGIAFRDALMKLDVIVSPVKSLLNGGDFDGFPTASLVEASLLGVTMVCSDPMNDSYYINGKEIIIVESNENEYIETLIQLMNNRQLCEDIGLKGQLRTMEIYDLKNTLIPKSDMIMKWLHA